MKIYGNHKNFLVLNKQFDWLHNLFSSTGIEVRLVTPDFIMTDQDFCEKITEDEHGNLKIKIWNRTEVPVKTGDFILKMNMQGMMADNLYDLLTIEDVCRIIDYNKEDLKVYCQNLDHIYKTLMKIDPDNKEITTVYNNFYKQISKIIKNDIAHLEEIMNAEGNVEAELTKIIKDKAKKVHYVELQKRLSYEEAKILFL